MKKIKLIKSFAGYPVGEYNIDGEYYYLKTRDWSEYTIHKDIVEGMLEYFETVEEKDRIHKAYNDYDSNKLLWKSKYKECFREAIEKFMPKMEMEELKQYIRYDTIRGAPTIYLDKLEEILKSKGLLK